MIDILRQLKLDIKVILQVEKSNFHLFVTFSNIPNGRLLTCYIITYILDINKIIDDIMTFLTQTRLVFVKSGFNFSEHLWLATHDFFLHNLEYFSFYYLLNNVEQILP